MGDGWGSGHRDGGNVPILLPTPIKITGEGAPHSSTLAWKTPWMEEPGGLQSMGSQRVGHDWATSLSLFIFTDWRRKWQPAPVFLPGESQGRGSLVGCHLWGRTESDTTEATQQQQQQHYQLYLLFLKMHFICLFSILDIAFQLKSTHTHVCFRL